MQQEEEGGQPETGIRTPTGWGGTQTGKQHEGTEEPGTVPSITQEVIITFLNDNKGQMCRMNLQCF